jgi:class 3 adenylate cyclase
MASNENLQQNRKTNQLRLNPHPQNLTLQTPKDAKRRQLTVMFCDLADSTKR